MTAPGNTAAVWEPTLARARPLRFQRRMAGLRVLVAAAHADDETLGAGGLIQVMHRRGAAVTVVICTDGAAAFAALDPARRRVLAATRRHEARAALRELGTPLAGLYFLDLPDGQAAAHLGQITKALTALATGCRWVLAPWRLDPHPDHQAVGSAAAQALPAGATLIEYPIWMRHSLTPNDRQIPADLRVLTLHRGQRARKGRAIAAHVSQLQIWDEASEPVLPGPVVALFRGFREPFFVSPDPSGAA